MDFTRDEFQLLNGAKKQSDALVHLENQAMNAMIGLFPNEEGHYVIQKKPDPLLAQKLMHSQKYHNIKKEIMGPMQEFFQRVDQRTAQTVAFYINKGRKLNHLFALFDESGHTPGVYLLCSYFLSRPKAKAVS